MKRILIRVAAAGLWLAGAAAGVPDELTIRLVDTPVVPRKALEEGERVAERILAQAGIRVQWMDCAAERCASVSSFWIQFVDRLPSWLPPDATGYAVPAPPQGMAPYAIVSYRSVVERAPEATALDAMLGAALAHEIGHLLLGRSAHTLNGIMSARLGSREIGMAARGALRFTDEQVRQIRGTMRRESAFRVDPASRSEQ
jgi:hypothetical protein